jgi:small subunit ribosomal protein S7
MPENKLLLFEKWDVAGIKVQDQGLQKAISLKPSIAVSTLGRHEHKKFGKLEVNIVERLANHIMHFGKKYAKNAGRMGGKKQKALKIVGSALDIIALKTGQNPIEVLVKAIENTAPNEDTTRIAYGGVVYHVAVDIAPSRRVDLALRFFGEGLREAAFSTARTAEEILADEIIMAAKNDTNSVAIKKKNEQERIAMSSR